MNIGLQLLIGFAPLLLVALLFLIRKKLFIAPIVLVTVMVASIGLGFYYSPKEDEQKKEIEQQTIEELLYVVGNDISLGEYNKANEMIDSIFQEYGDDARLSLFAARIKILNGDYGSALVLFDKAQMLDDKLEISDKEKAIFARIKDNKLVTPMQAAQVQANILNIQNNNLKPEDFGLEVVMTPQEASDEFEKNSQVVLDGVESDINAIKKSNDANFKAVDKSIEHANTIAEEYQKFVTTGRFDEDKVDESFSSLNKTYSKNPSVSQIDVVDEAYVEATCLLKNYKYLARYAQETDSPRALATVAGLYINGTIEEKDFPDNFVSLDENQYEKVLTQCEKACDKVEDKTEDINIVSSVEDKVETMDIRKNNMVLAEIDQRLEPTSVDISKQSKYFLQSSNISSKLGDDDKANKEFKSALDTAAYSSDTAYSKPMQQIVSIVNETSESQEIVNTGDYIDQAYQNSFPVKVNEEITTSKELKNSATTYVSTKLAKINISKVDTSKFPEITANVQTGEPLKLDNLKLTLTDVGVAIKDFTIEENKFNQAKIYLTCDISGSMRGNEEDLKTSVKKFVSTMTSKEEVSIIGFDDNVVFDSGFMDKSGNFDEYIDKLNPSGGTNIGGAAYASIDNLSKDDDCFNIVILMTDGQDGSFSSQESLYELRRRCEANNVVLFTIGLGPSVEVEYLKKIAEYGNGSYMQCNDASGLDSLYAFIHKQLENNYTLKYKAVDQTTNRRLVTLNNSEDNSTGKRTYFLNYTTDENGEAQENEFVDLTGDSIIKGVDTPVIYKSPNVKPVFNLLGENLSKAEGVVVNISGAGNYVAESKLIDDTTIEVILPEGVVLGEYDVNVTLNGQKFTLKNAITIEDGVNSQTLTFGAYTFEAAKIEDIDSGKKLSGNVVMNDFIRFKGDVYIYGDINSLQVELDDQYGSRIEFTKKLPGLLGTIYSNTMNLPMLGRFKIYNDKSHMNDLDNYHVETMALPNLTYAVIGYKSPSISLYPHKIDISVGEINADLPFQKEILKYNGVSPFTASGKANGIITPEGIGITGEFSAEPGEYVKLSVVPISLNSLDIKFDTYNNDYYIKLTIGSKSIIPSIEDDAAYGFDIGFKGGKWDQLSLYADIPIVVCETPPVSISDFMVGVEGLSKEAQSGSFGKRLAAATFKGSFDTAICKLADLIPELASFFDDASLLTLDDTTVTITFKDFALTASTTAKLFGYIECGSCEMAIGHFDYDNYLLGIDSTNVAGLLLKSSVGPKLDVANIKISSTGSSTITINEKFAGIWNRGEISYEIQLFRNHKNSCNGNLMMGLHNNCKQFSIIVKGESVTNNAEVGFKLTIGGKSIIDVDFY